MLRSIEGETAEQLKYWPRPSPLGFFSPGGSCAAGNSMSLARLRTLAMLSIRWGSFEGHNEREFTIAQDFSTTFQPIRVNLCVKFEFPCRPISFQLIFRSRSTSCREMRSPPPRFPMTESSTTEKEIRRDKECKHSPPPNFILARRL